MFQYFVVYIFDLFLDFLPWSVAKQSMMSKLSHRAWTSSRVPNIGLTWPWPCPIRLRSSWHRNRWCGQTSQVIASPWEIQLTFNSTVLIKLYKKSLIHRRKNAFFTFSLAARMIWISSFRATWQTWTGRLCKLARSKTAAVVCPSAWTQRGYFFGQLSKCYKIINADVICPLKFFFYKCKKCSQKISLDL